MPFVDVDPRDESQIEALTRVIETVRAHDDPDCFVQTIEDVCNQVRIGGDLHPGRFTMLTDDRGDAAGVDHPIGYVVMYVPVHDNRHLVEAEVAVLPAMRGRGHTSYLLAEVERRTPALGRTTLWIGAAADDEAAITFLTRHGFARASGDARRRQALVDLDGTEIDGLERDAAEHATDYVLERLEPPYDDALLTAMITATAAINDAPMGALAFEDEVYDLGRLRDVERALELRGERFRRVVARHRTTGDIAGHTALTVRPWAPREAYQFDTSVARGHRGHRLGLALKIAMLRWLAEAEPQLEVIETWNNVDNAPMIRVNEALGYRLSREFAMFQRVLPPNA